MRLWTMIVLVPAAVVGWLALAHPADERAAPSPAANEPTGNQRHAAPQSTVDQAPPETSTLQAFMRLKLAHAQDVLEGLATEDFGQIARGAQQLRALAADASWNVFETDEYTLYSREFVDAARQMSKAARDKNIDTAALAYVQLTLACVQCHKHVRDVRTAQLPPALVRPKRPLAGG